jgi:hypothetical protein
MARACIGLLEERGKTGEPVSPIEATRFPDGSVTATLPRWRLSANPDRTISATGSPPR